MVIIITSLTTIKVSAYELYTSLHYYITPSTEEICPRFKNKQNQSQAVPCIGLIADYSLHCCRTAHDAIPQSVFQIYDLLDRIYLHKISNFAVLVNGGRFTGTVVVHAAI